VAQEDAHKWKEYEEPHNVFDDDEEYKAPEWRAYEAPHNVFDDMDAEESPKWKPMEPEENALADMPDAYPFDETKDGHEWKKWDEGKSASDMIKEHNVFDDGTTTEMTYQVGHTGEKPNPGGKMFFPPFFSSHMKCNGAAGDSLMMSPCVCHSTNRVS
jgi:hypothetical protein